MNLCKFGQNSSTGSEDNAQKRSYADANADEIRLKNNMPPSPLFGCEDIIVNARIAGKNDLHARTLCKHQDPDKMSQIGAISILHYIQEMFAFNPRWGYTTSGCCGNITINVPRVIDGGGETSYELRYTSNCVLHVFLDRKKIQGHGITAEGVTSRILYLLLHNGPTQVGRND